MYTASPLAEGYYRQDFSNTIMPSESAFDCVLKMTALVASIVVGEVYCILDTKCECVLVERREMLQLASFEFVSLIV
jgi:hypothetical protein